MNEPEPVIVTYNEISKLVYASCPVPADVTQCIETEVQKMMASDFKDSLKYTSALAGSIRGEYAFARQLDDRTAGTESVDFLDQFLKVVTPRYWDPWKDPRGQKEHRLRISNHISAEYGFPIKDLWVNFQKKNEINPIHSHSGALSFVIWHKIPYDIEKEKEFADIGNIPIAGNFVFNYPDYLARGGIRQHSITVDKSRENTMIIFHASMQHVVYPFYTSDEYRISISGNLEII